ncbi:MAG: chemotaxis response regulator protein-glutamate methylesterase [Planctomycetota bacterium]
MSSLSPHIPLTSSRLRVLVVDDSALYRQTVSRVLADFSDVEVVGIAKDGCDAIEKVQALQPDLLTLDVEMPNMNGIETLREMKRLRTSARAIMLSSLTEAGAKVTLDALFEGAFDFIQKPTGGLVSCRGELSDSLREKLDAFQSHQQRTRELTQSASSLASNPVVTSAVNPPLETPACKLVVIGLSTGGPQTLRHVLPRLDADFPVPVIVVQHMPARYTSAMASRLDETCGLAIREAAEGDSLRPGGVWIAPGGQHLRVYRSAGLPTLQTTMDPAEHSCRPAVDYTLRSCVEVYGGGILSVILTGMGRDGQSGCQAVCTAGGTVFAQDESTSAVFGMPKAVIDAGLASRILPLGKVAPAIMRHVHRHAVRRSSS